jgi:integrase
MGQILELNIQSKVKKSPRTKGVKELDRRPRDHLYPAEAEAIIKAAKKIGRYPLRDSTMIRLAYGHGLRATEVCSLQWSDLDLYSGLPIINIQRLKDSQSDTHPLYYEELKGLRALHRERQKALEATGIDSPYVFVTERLGPLSKQGFWQIIKRAGEAAKLPFPIHPHMLRHGCGHRLRAQKRDIREIQEFLGHKNIQNTVRYTKGGPDRFKGFGR